MRIIEVSVTDLFGIFNHTIPLNLDDRITIIHGPNGFGKTILLKMLSGLFNGRYSVLRDVPFQDFRVKFEDGSTVWVDKKPGSEQKTLFDELDDGIIEHNGSVYISVNFSEANSTEVLSFFIDPTLPGKFPLSMLEKMLPVERIGADEWFLHPDGEIISSKEAIDRFAHLLPARFVPERPDWWENIRSSVEIHLIETQRLLNIRESRASRKRPKMIPAVEVYSDELAETIQDKLVESATLSQSLDRTFPTRLVEQMGKSNLTENQLEEKLKGLETKRSKLKDVGLLDKEDDIAFLPTKEIGGDTKDVLSVYVQDVEQKLSFFDEIAAKIDLFREIINRRFLYNRMSISKQLGFIFTTFDGKPLPNDALSSGEQHELVLLYQLLFKVKPNSLILIDEPELSLHVAWQKQFLQDLQEIIKLASFDILIATHSPQIIHDRWDLTVELEGPKDQ